MYHLSTLVIIDCSINIQLNLPIWFFILKKKFLTILAQTAENFENFRLKSTENIKIFQSHFVSSIQQYQNDIYLPSKSQ